VAVPARQLSAWARRDGGEPGRAAGLPAEPGGDEVVGQRAEGPVDHRGGFGAPPEPGCGEGRFDEARRGCGCGVCGGPEEGAEPAERLRVIDLARVDLEGVERQGRGPGRPREGLEPASGGPEITVEQPRRAEVEPVRQADRKSTR